MPVLDIAQQVASVSIRIFGGEKAGSIKVSPVAMAVPKFDWREMQRWGIPESRLPPGSEIFFRPPSVWQQHRTAIIAICAGILFQGLVIAWLLYEHRLRQLAETLALQRANQLAYMNRTATAGELSASIAHEVKQPLAAIVANANAALRWLAKQTPNIDEARLALNRMVDEGHRASHVIDDIRGMFRKDTTPREPVDLNALISETLLLVGHDAHTNNIAVNTYLRGGAALRTIGDRIQLQQVFLNLLVNAIEAIQSGTRHPRVIAVSSVGSKERGVVVTVEDSGPGLDPSNADKIFEMFFTTKEKGMGIGLAMCRSILESHRGTIEVSTSELGGCRFDVCLPNSEESETI